MRQLLRLSRAAALMSLAVGLPLNALRADEGMWLLNAPPTKRLKEQHGFEPSPAWLELVQKASVRFNNGGSGSFVSPDGLIITNHHVASDIIQKLSTAEKNYMRDGFYAANREQELKCTDLELNVLISIENVTDRINAAVKRGASASDAFAARRAAKAEIEKESLEKTGLRSDVVTLYQGAEYHLYRYKRYTDVRLVFAPEVQAAFFGGDPDNFEFPRYCLDVTFFRAYENGQPAKVQHYLKFQPNGTQENELIFVTGHPGSTSRALTTEELQFQRDVRVPHALEFIKTMEVALSSWSARSKENARRARDDLFSFQNSRKVFDGRIAALLGSEIWEAKRAEEEQVKAFIKDRPDLAEVVNAWPRIAEAQQTIARNYDKMYYLETTLGNSTLFRIGRGVYRAAVERPKASGERLREYRDSNRESLELELFSDEPIYDDLEHVKLTQLLTLMAYQLGAEDPAVKAALAGKTPAQRASEAIFGTKLKDVEFRKKIYGMAPADAEKVDDPMLALVRAVDPAARSVRKTIEEQNEVKEQAHALIEKARYAKFGSSIYPDATFTLRLSYGLVKSYQEQGKTIEPYTEIGGTFTRSEEHGGREPFDLPASWTKARPKMNLGAKYNFVSTADIIGGNSGSPTINRAGEFIGIIFDGNIYSLVADYGYSDVQSRAISVDVRGIVEALKSIYGTEALLKELMPK
jgi:hypothetical protein